jgi:RNA-directed DNA polymerase
LEKRIDDRRFLRLMRLMLQAGYMEDWKCHRTYSGTPQGGSLHFLQSC